MSDVLGALITRNCNLTTIWLKKIFLHILCLNMTEESFVELLAGDLKDSKQRIVF